MKPVSLFFVKGTGQMGAGPEVFPSVRFFKKTLSMYETISSFESLLPAYYRARSCKRYNSAILRFGLYLEGNLFRLQRELIKETYRPSAYVCFTVHDPKERKVAAPHFRDRVLQHSLIAQIEPLFEKSFIYDSYACRIKKGTHFGLSRVKKFLQAARSLYGKDADIYCLTMDISKFFASMSWNVLLPLMFQKVSCPKTRRLIEKIVTQYQFFDEYGYPFNPEGIVTTPRERKGLPIGNLTSQLFANIYLNELDQFVKHTLHVRWYGRYMDDFLVIHPDKTYLRNIEKEIRTFLTEKLRLHVSEKKVIITNVKNGVPFVGYLIFHDHILIRGQTLRRMQRKLRKRRGERKDGIIKQPDFYATINSLTGHFNHANSWHLKDQMFSKKELWQERKIMKARLKKIRPTLELQDFE